jgi:hypothetical protein
MAGAGHYEKIGGRQTFVPPFVNERFDGPPFWACTFTALLNGANVGWLGQKPATHAEVAALAGASGDDDTHGGSRSSHMIRALKVRYKASLAIERCNEREVLRRLANGGALVAGVTYGELPTRYRRWSPRFKRGHRVTVFGLSGGRTRLLDPMAAKGPDYAGEWITWSDFAKAWWPDEQLWFHEGQFVGKPAAPAIKAAAPKPAVPAGPPVTARFLRRFDPPRHFRVAANTKVVGYAPGRPPAAVRRASFAHASGASFDAIVAFDPAVTIEDQANTYLQVTNGVFAGRYIPVATAGLSADIRPDQPAPVVLTPEVAVVEPTIATTLDDSTLAETTLDPAVLEGRRLEWDRIAQATAGIVILPPRP